MDTLSILFPTGGWPYNKTEMSSDERSDLRDERATETDLESVSECWPIQPGRTGP